MNWKPGDIALCIVSGPRTKTRSGSYYTVSEVMPNCLNFLELDLPPTLRCCPRRFIRIDPEILTEVHDLNIERITT